MIKLTILQNAEESDSDQEEDVLHDHLAVLHR